MIRAKTVFIVGAGASFELDFPIGVTLLTDISRTLHFRFDFGRIKSGDPAFSEHLKRTAYNLGDPQLYQPLIRAAQRIDESAAGARSIDSVIDENDHEEHVALVGKLAIAYVIAKAESSSKLSSQDGSDDRLDLSKVANTWLSSFASLLREGIKRSQLDGIFANVKVICFNYDRSIERFLPHFISKSYGVSLHEAEAISQRLEILHPYGFLGPLPSQNSAPQNTCPYGGLAPGGLQQTAERIRTFTEQLGSSELAAIHDTLLWADRIVFLGFGFHPSNMRLLTPPDEVREGVQVYATAYKQPPPSLAAITMAISRMLTNGRTDGTAQHKVSLGLPHIEAHQFMQDYSMLLAS